MRGRRASRGRTCERQGGRSMEYLRWFARGTSESCLFFFFSSRRRHTRFDCDWSSDVCSSDLKEIRAAQKATSVEFRKAVEKSAENVRCVSEKQLPRPWTVETTPGVKIHQVVDRKSVV